MHQIWDRMVKDIPHARPLKGSADSCQIVAGSLVFHARNTLGLMVGPNGHFVVNLCIEKVVENDTFLVLWVSKARVKFQPFSGKAQHEHFDDVGPPMSSESRVEIESETCISKLMNLLLFITLWNHFDPHNSMQNL